MAIQETSISDIEFSDTELQTIDNALLMLEEAFSGKVIPPKAEDHALKDIEQWTNVICDNVNLIPAFTSMIQWAKDEKLREQLNPRALRLQNIARHVIYTNRVMLQRCWASSTMH